MALINIVVGFGRQQLDASAPAHSPAQHTGGAAQPYCPSDADRVRLSCPRILAQIVGVSLLLKLSIIVHPHGKLMYHDRLDWSHRPLSRALDETLSLDYPLPTLSAAFILVGFEYLVLSNCHLSY